MKKATVLLALFATLFITGTAFAQNGSTVIKGEQCSWLYNECCDEFVEVCFTYNMVLDKDGFFKHVNLSGSGTGENGTEYSYKGVQNWSGNADGKGADNMTITASIKLSAGGDSDCSFTAHYNVHITRNANGEYTAEVENLRLECENGTVIE